MEQDPAEDQSSDRFKSADGTESLLTSISIAQSIPAASETGTIQDVKHIVILMQENRSFDHYLGRLAGVRGFGDPRPVVLPANGYPVWYQPKWKIIYPYVLPFRPAPQPPDIKNSDIYYSGLAHDWQTGHDAWNNGQYDNWVSAKTEGTMAYFTGEDIPYYYSLAQAFTVCDSYHCSLLGPTNPNRLYLWTGCCGNVAGAKPCINNQVYGSSWMTLPERLNEVGISWRFYQDKGQGLEQNSGFGEYPTGASNDLWWNGNYGDNTLLNFKQYQHISPTDPLSPVLNGTQIDPKGNGKPYDIELFRQLKDDVINDSLPQVSWVVAPFAYTEHPSWAASGGEWYVSNILNALTSNPDVWASTVFFITYDENDGYFDHVPPPVPPTALHGKSNVSTAAEFYSRSQTASNGSLPGDKPLGLGVRVPMIVVSPWSKGGKVNSELFDHTSIIRFIETRFNTALKPLRETNISVWRRTVCGDLTSAFDFSAPDQAGPFPGIANSGMNLNGSPVISTKPPDPQSLPMLSPGQRMACRLPYAFSVTGGVNRIGKQMVLAFANTGQAGVSLQVRSENTSIIPRHYTVAAKSEYQDALSVDNNGNYDLSIYGPNGFLQELRGSIGSSAKSGASAEVQLYYNSLDGIIHITLDNTNGDQDSSFRLTDNAYDINPLSTVTVSAGMSKDIFWSDYDGWYDVSIRIVGDIAYFRRFAGCAQKQSGPLLTDPAIGNINLFVPAFATQGYTSDTLRFDYVVPPWNFSPKNWIGVYKQGVKPGQILAPARAWVYAPRNAGSVPLDRGIFDISLAPGQYDAWYLFDGGYKVLSGPIPLTIVKPSI